MRNPPRHLETAVDADRAGMLATLYREHADSAVRLAYLITGEEAVAEELVHEAFIRVAGRWTHVRDPEAFGRYLRQTVVNLARMHLRRRGIERRHLHTALAPRGEQPGTEWEVTAREAIRSCLLALPYRQRAAIVLRVYLDLPDGEIAAILRCRPATVRSLVSRGLVRLRAVMRGEDDDG